MQSCINEDHSNNINSNIIIYSNKIDDRMHNIHRKHQYPVARWKHAAVIYENYLYIMGGYSWTNTLKDLWRLNLSGLNKLMADQFKSMGTWNSMEIIDNTINLWEDLSKFQGCISPLQSHTMVAYRNRLYIFGGAFTYDTKNCPFWIYDIENKKMQKWKSTDPDISLPIPRRNHSCCLYRNSMVMYGGFGDVRGSLNDLWSYNFDTEKWHLMWTSQYFPNARRDLIKSGPRSRHDHRAVVHRRVMLIFGGMSGLEMCNDMWQWSFDEFQWTKLVYRGDHTDLSYLTDVKISNYWLLFGINDVKKKTEKWIYSFRQNKWTTSMYNIPQFHPFSTLLVFSKNQTNVEQLQKVSPPIRSKYNKVYPISIESLDSIDDYNTIDSINLQTCCISNTAVQIRSSDHYRHQRLESYNTLSKETIFTNVSDISHCETTFMNNSNGEEVPIDCYNRELLIIVGNNIEKASFDYHLNMQLLYL